MVDSTEQDDCGGIARYKRILIKVSGEVLMGDSGFGIDATTTHRVAREIADIARSGLQLCLVIGGGNIYRGIEAAASGMDRATGDYMGMLATVMNALAMQHALTGQGVEARVMSAIPMPTVCESYARALALSHLDKGRVVIFAGGTGNPFFTTDTAAVLRAAETNCSALFKGTSVDGVYSGDPQKNPGVHRYDHISHERVLAQDLKIMDAAAIALAKDNALPVIVFSIRQPGALAAALTGSGPSTRIG